MVQYPKSLPDCSTLTMKACRKLLEEDMGLPEKSLAAHKEWIQRYVDKVNLCVISNSLCAALQA